MPIPLAIKGGGSYAIDRVLARLLGTTTTPTTARVATGLV